MDIENDLKGLDTLQVSILFWRQRKLPDKEIGGKFGKGEDWVEARMSEIYKELGFDPKMHAKQKKKILEDDYLPVVKLLTNDDPDTLAGWPLKAKHVDQNRPKATPQTRQSSKTVDQQRRPSPRPNRAWLWIAILLLFVGALYGAYLFGRKSVPQSPAPTFVTTIPANTQVDTPQPSAAPTEKTSETNVISTAVPSDTPPPSDTPIPSPVQTEPPAFFDDFANGLNPAWTVEYGKPVVSNEQLVASELTLLSVGDPTWTNYQVEFDVQMGRFTCGRDPSFVGVRGSDVDNMLVFTFTPCDSEWSSVINGQWSPIPGTKIGNQGYTDVLVRFVVTVEGNKIVIREQSNILGSIVDTDHVSGNVYLRIKPDTKFDNFKITLLNP